MSDENPNPEQQAEQPAEKPAEGTESATPAPGTPDPEKPTEGAANKVEDLPAWAQKLISDTRGEAANYRTRATSAETKLAEAKTPEDIAAAVAAVTAEKAQLERTLLVTRVASEFTLPADLAALLQGDDEAALKAHATTLAKYAGGSSNDPQGGLDGGTGDEAFDPAALAREARRKRY